MRFLLDTLVLVSIYVLLAVGYVVVYRASKVLNLAHGDFMMLGGFSLFWIATLTGTHAAGAGEIIGLSVISIIISCLVGLIIYRIFIHPVLGEDPVIPVMVTIGLSIILRGIATFAWGSQPRYLASLMGIKNPYVELWGGYGLSRFDLILIAAAIFFIIALGLFFRYYKRGIQIRAASENPLLASLSGVNIYSSFVLMWAVSIILASVAGILYGITSHVDTSIGIIGLNAFSVAIVGGLYSLAGVVPAAFLIALAENAMAHFYDPLLAGVVPMAILLLVLIFRPWGILGRPEEIERV